MILLGISASNSPYIRVSKGKWYERVYPYPKPKSAKATFHWLTKKESGVFLTNYRIQEDVILPICFIDKNNQPMSQTWCVVFENIKRKGKYRMEAEIYFLLEEAPNALLEPGNHFLVFGHTSKIGVEEVH